MTILLVGWLVTARMAHAAGGTAMDAFNFVTGARAAGMGGAAVAVVDDVTALQWNPAWLARMPGFGATLSHLIWVAGINYSYAGVAVPVPAKWSGLPVNGTVGASLQVLNYGSIESTRGLAAAVDASDLGGTVGGALRIGHAVSGGIALKYFHHALAGSGVSEAAVDAGAAYEAVPDALEIGLAVQNLGYSGALEGRQPPLPASMKLGLGFAFDITREPLPVEDEEPRWEPKVRTLISGDVIAYQRGEPVNYAVGGEANLNQFLFARLGFQSALRGAGGSAGLSAGVGLAFFGFHLDYAYGSVGDLGHAQFVTLSWAYGGKPATAAAPAAAEAAAKPAAAAAPTMPATRPASAEADFQAAYDLNAAGKYPEAAAKAQAAVDADPGYWEAWQLLGTCRYSQNDRAGALEAFRKSLELHPDNPALKSFVDQLSAP